MFKIYEEKLEKDSVKDGCTDMNFFETLNRAEMNILKKIVRKYHRVYKLHSSGLELDRYYALKVIDCKLKVNCLNGCLGFKYILQKEPKAVILSSGTLTPFNYYESAFETTFDLKL